MEKYGGLMSLDNVISNPQCVSLAFLSLPI
jgi:hypothetical protein